MKQCSVCGEVKLLSEYKKHPETKDKLYSYCNACLREKMREYRARTKNAVTKRYEKTPKGFLMRMYRNMKSRISGVQKQKAHLYCGKELLDKATFYLWAMSSESFFVMYDAYVKSDYDRRLAPTVDRIDSTKGYYPENMQWLTHAENSKKGCYSRHNKKN